MCRGNAVILLYNKMRKVTTFVLLDLPVRNRCYSFVISLAKLSQKCHRFVIKCGIFLWHRRIQYKHRQAPLRAERSDPCEKDG